MIARAQNASHALGVFFWNYFVKLARHGSEGPSEEGLLCKGLRRIPSNFNSEYQFFPTGNVLPPPTSGHGQLPPFPETLTNLHCVARVGLILNAPTRDGSLGDGQVTSSDDASPNES